MMREYIGARHLATIRGAPIIGSHLKWQKLMETFDINPSYRTVPVRKHHVMGVAGM
jgi:hypothetical protein